MGVTPVSPFCLAARAHRYKVLTEILEAARARRIDAVVIGKIDRWGRSLSDLVATLKELTELGVSFVTVTEFFDLGTSTAKAMAGAK